MRHDYWHKEGLSGVITCCIKTLTPLVVGAKHDEAIKEKHPGRVHPYQHPDGTIAIPANSLRGMISALVESISQSSLRVLNQRTKTQYSMRESVYHPLKKMGLLLRDENDEFVLYHLGDAQKGIPKSNRQNLKTYQHSDNNEIKEFYGKTGIHYIRGDVFNRKKHETFIEWNGELQGAGIPVNKQVEIFQQTLQRYAKNLSHPEKAIPFGYTLETNTETGDYEPVVRAGDLVYYREEDGNISELSYSQIWRKHIKWDLYEAIETAGGKNALPWSPDRTHLTPAEALFGTVEEEPDTEKGARNLASRLRFSDAIPTESLQLNNLKDVILKILDSPKPPSPCMYFQSPDGSHNHISKDDLATKLHKPNGRKHYLPHPEKNGEHWQSQYTLENPPTRDNKINWLQYLMVKPIPKNTQFNFTIHFENLSQQELDLLITSIEPAEKSAQFVHKLGLGKPLGLGSLQLTIEKVETIDRHKRYNVSQLKQPSTKDYTIKPLETRIADTNSLIDAETLKDLQTLYNPENIKHPICYPFDSSDSKQKQQPYNENEGYKWFTTNEKKTHRTEQLKPVKSGEPIPELDSFGS